MRDSLSDVLRYLKIQMSVSYLNDYKRGGFLPFFMSARFGDHHMKTNNEEFYEVIEVG